MKMMYFSWKYMLILHHMFSMSWKTHRTNFVIPLQFFLGSKMGLHADISGFPELSAGIYVSNVAAKKRTRRNCHGELV